MSGLLFDDLYREPLAKPSPTGEQLKAEGMRRAAESKESQLGYARYLAVDLARDNGGLCHADMVAAALEAEGRPSLGNAAGSLFSGDQWTWTGEFVKSQRPHAHSNLLRLWRYKF